MERRITNKQTEMDWFARRYYCQHARLNYARWIKKQNHKKVRRIAKAELIECQPL